MKIREIGNNLEIINLAITKLGVRGIMLYGIVKLTYQKTKG